MLNLKTMSDPLSKAASASEQFEDGMDLYLKGGLLSVWYYRCNYDGKPMEDGMWCYMIRGIVRDGMNHIVDVKGMDSIQCSGKLCKHNDGAGAIICKHAVAVLAYAAKNTTHEPMPDALNLNISTYLTDYTEEDKIADHARAAIITGDESEYDTAMFDEFGKGSVGRTETPDAFKRRHIETCARDFEAVQRNSSDGMSMLRINLKLDVDAKTQALVLSCLDQGNVGTAKSEAKFDISLAYLQKAIFIYADTQAKRRAHIRQIIDMWTKANMRYGKKCLVQALIELGTSYGDLWRSDVIWHMKKNVRKITVTVESRADDDDDDDGRYPAGKSKGISNNASLSEMCSYVLHLIKSG